MTKKTAITIALFFTAWFINSACKKKDSTTTPSTSPSVTNTISSTGDPSGTFSGFFVEDNSVGGGTEVVFYNTPISIHLSTTDPGTPTGTVVAVYCNNVKFAYDATAGPIYGDSTQGLTYPPAVWQVTGNTTFPSFTYTCTTAMPTYNNGASLPALINRSQNLSIPTSGAASYDQVIINISDAAGYTTSNLAANASATSLVCVKDTLTKLTPTTNGNISVELIKYNPQNINGKNYLFMTTITYNKTNVVIQ